MASDILAPTPETPLYAPTRIFAFSGRLNPVRYLMWTSITGLTTVGLLWVLFSASSPTGPAYLVLMLGACAGGVLGVRRVMDIGWPWWLYGMIFIPLLGTFFSLIIIGHPGTKGANQYGLPTKPATGVEIAVSVLCLIVGIFTVFQFASSPAGERFFRML